MDKKIDAKGPKKRKKTVRILLIILCVLVAALIACAAIIYADVSKMWGDLGDEEDTVVETTDEGNVDSLPEVTFQGGDAFDIDKTSEEIDIMLIGVDNRNSEKFTGLSDVMMYMRVNTSEKSIKIVSFMRDTLVEIEGHGKNKLNTAYSYGQIDLMYQTYYDSFGLTPDYYMVVNFYGMEDIIDALGGVDVDLESNELNSLNSSIREINALDSGEDSATISESGLQHLNGRQAVAYMRIRKPGTDAGRIARQQKVLSALFKEASSIGIGEAPALVTTLAQYVRTDIPLGTMLDLANSVQGMSDDNLQTFRYPEEYETGYYKGAGDVVQPTDFETEFQKLYDFLNG